MVYFTSESEYYNSLTKLKITHITFKLILGKYLAEMHEDNHFAGTKGSFVIKHYFS